jgi:hypothetical protein
MPSPKRKSSLKHKSMVSRHTALIRKMKDLIKRRNIEGNNEGYSQKYSDLTEDIDEVIGKIYKTEEDLLKKGIKSYKRYEQHFSNKD